MNYTSEAVNEKTICEKGRKEARKEWGRNNGGMGSING